MPIFEFFNLLMFHITTDEPDRVAIVFSRFACHPFTERSFGAEFDFASNHVTLAVLTAGD